MKSSQKMGGDWHKNRDNFRAMREEIKQLHAALNTGQSIHVETTLSGQGKAQLNLIERAHQNGFEVTLLYVALKNKKVAINRVHERVKKVGTVYQMKLLKNVIYQQSHSKLIMSWSMIIAKNLCQFTDEIMTRWSKIICVTFFG